MERPAHWREDAWAAVETSGSRFVGVQGDQDTVESGVVNYSAIRCSIVHWRKSGGEKSSLCVLRDVIALRARCDLIHL
jgi:hypothetical protein